VRAGRALSIVIMGELHGRPDC